MRYADEDRAGGLNTMTRDADHDFCTPGAHKTVLATHKGTPNLYGAECSCGWEDNTLYTDPEAAEEKGAHHEHQATTAAAS